MPATHRFILLILLVDKKYLIIIFSISFRLYIILCKAVLMHCLIVDNKNIKIINKAWSI